MQGRPTTEPHLFTVQQSLATTARNRDVLAIGDWVSRVHFDSNGGANIALADADNLASAIVEGARSGTPQARDAILDQWAHRTHDAHRVLVARSQEDVGELLLARIGAEARADIATEVRSRLGRG